VASVEKRQSARGVRYDVRYRDPDGNQHRKSFMRKSDADRFASVVEADKLRRTFIDPDAGRVSFKSYADKWLAAQSFDFSTREAVELRLRLHVYPILGRLQLRHIKPSAIQAWLRGLEALAPSYRRVILANVSTVLSAAADDELIAKNPCRAASVRTPKVEPRKIVPWSADEVLAVHNALPARYRIVATLAAGLGLRQGEVFGLAINDVDFLRGRVEVRRQVKLFSDGSLAFARPKSRRSRTVPLPASVRDELAAYLVRHPSRDIALPWEHPEGERLTELLVLSNREGRALNRTYFNTHVWKPALTAAGLETSRKNGCHALPHFYASVLLDAGESIKAVSEYLGHADAGFTLRTYTHLMPSSDERTRRAIDGVFSRDREACAITVPSSG
jgi:integrase